MQTCCRNDGGAIFKSYNDGVVNLMMQGSCSGCPSSMITLKQNRRYDETCEVKEAGQKLNNLFNICESTCRPVLFYFEEVNFTIMSSLLIISFKQLQ